MTESDVLRSIRLRLNKYGRYFRNNTGVLKDARGIPVRFGLCPGSSDLIGWTLVDGVAVFTAIEVKTDKGRVSKSQENFIDTVNASGGISFVARSADEAEEKIKELI